MENNLTQEVKERISKKIRESAVSSGGIYFVDAESRDFDIVLFPLVEINVGGELCTVRVPKKISGIFQKQ